MELGGEIFKYLQYSMAPCYSMLKSSLCMFVESESLGNIIIEPNPK